MSSIITYGAVGGFIGAIFDPLILFGIGLCYGAIGECKGDLIDKKKILLGVVIGGIFGLCKTVLTA